MNGGNPWKDDEVARLRALVAEHKLTYREIAVALGRGKDSVIGKCFRLKLPPPPAEQDGKARGPGGKWLKVAAADKPPVAPVLPLVQPVAWLFNRVFPAVHVCQWPTSEGKPWAFCEAPVAPGRPYCAEHAARAFHTPSRRGGDTVNWTRRYG